MTSNDDFVLSDNFYSGGSNESADNHADNLRKSVSIPHSISNTSIHGSLRNSSSNSSIQKTSAMKSSPSMKALESILNLKSEPSSASTSAVASITEEREDHQSIPEEEEPEDEEEEEDKNPTSVFSLQSARESTHSVQTFHSSKSHTSGSTHQNNGVTALSNRLSMITMDGDKTPVLQMTDNFEDGDETPIVNRSKVDEQSELKDDDNDGHDTTLIEQKVSEEVENTNIEGAHMNKQIQKLVDGSPITATSTSSSSSLLPPPSIPNGSPAKNTNSNSNASAGAGTVPTFNVLEPSPSLKVETNTPSKSMIPDYIPRIQPPSKRNTPSSNQSSTPKQTTSSSTFDTPHTVTTRPSVQSTPRTPRSHYENSASSYSLHNTKKLITETPPPINGRNNDQRLVLLQNQQQNQALNHLTPKYSHKRSSTLSDLSQITHEEQQKVPSAKKFSFKKLFKLKSKQHSLNEEETRRSPAGSVKSRNNESYTGANATSIAADSAPRIKLLKKPRSFSSPNLSKLTEMPKVSSSSQAKGSVMSTPAPPTQSSLKGSSPSSSSFLNVFKKNRSSENLLSMKRDSSKPSSIKTNAATPQSKMDETSIDNITTPNSNGFFIREVNDEDYEMKMSPPNFDDLEDYESSKGLLTVKKQRIITPKSNTKPDFNSTANSTPTITTTAANRRNNNRTEPDSFTVPSIPAFTPLLSSTPNTRSSYDSTTSSTFVPPSTLAPPPTAPSRFSAVLDERPLSSGFGSPFEVSYSPKDSVEEFSNTTSSIAKRERDNQQLLGEALFPKSLNAQEVESIVSLERSRSMKSFRSSSNKRNSFVNYDGSNENIIQGDSSILSSPDHTINRSTSILKNSDSKRNLQIDSVIENEDLSKILKPTQLVGGGEEEDHDQYSFEESGNFNDFIEFQDFINVENLNFSPQLSFDKEFDVEIESLEASPLPQVETRKEELSPIIQLNKESIRKKEEVDLPALPGTKSGQGAGKSSRIQLPKKTSRESFTKDLPKKSSRDSLAKDLPRINTEMSKTPLSSNTPVTSAATNNSAKDEKLSDEAIVSTPLTPNLEQIERPAATGTSPAKSQAESLIEQAFSNTPELNQDGRTTYNNRPISMSFRGLNGPSFQGKLALQNIRSSSSHQSFNISFADSSDVGSSTGVIESEYDNEDEDEDDDDESGIGNGFGSDNEAEIDDDNDDDDYASKNIPNFDPPPTIGKKKSNGSIRNNNTNEYGYGNGYGNGSGYGNGYNNGYSSGTNNGYYSSAPSPNSITSSPRSFSSLIARSWKRPAASPRVPPKPPTVILPTNHRNGVRFSSRIVLYDTYNGDEYDRHPDTATCNQLTPMLAQQIKEELNMVKLQMPVHESSRCYTHFF